jgi:hypothetical protein
MIRDIKFRAFIKSLKWIVPVVMIDFAYNTVEVDLSYDGGTSEYDFDEVELMEFMGLHNGKEIYEGDIVSGINRISGDEVPQKVTFLNGCFMFGNWNAHEYFNKHQFITVIGNIYDNPELLEVSK